MVTKPKSKLKLKPKLSTQPKLKLKLKLSSQPKRRLKLNNQTQNETQTRYSNPNSNPNSIPKAKLPNSLDLSLGLVHVYFIRNLSFCETKKGSSHGYTGRSF